jgi:hypothetical protein
MYAIQKENFSYFLTSNPYSPEPDSTITFPLTVPAGRHPQPAAADGKA